MLQENTILEVERRQESGKNAAIRLRAQNRIPAVIYGGGKDMDTLALTVDRKALLTLLRGGLHENTIFKLRLKGTDQHRHVMIRDLTVSPVDRSVLHVDFVRVLMDRKLRVKAPVACTGTAHGVKEGGILDVVTRELLIECLPADIPSAIEVDVTKLEVHDAIRVSDLVTKADAKYKVLEPSDRVIVHVTVAKGEVAATATTEAAAATPGAAEPEVIKKGKKEEAAPAADAKGGAKPAAAAAKAAPAAKPAGKEKK
jgi:large subunit ribosomal protein L25